MMTQVTLPALITETGRRLDDAMAETALQPADNEISYYSGVLAILVGYRAVAETLEPK